MREEKALVEADNIKWKERVDKLLQKYERVDPVEYQKALEERDQAVKSLEEERAERETEVSWLTGYRSISPPKLNKLKAHVKAYKTKAEELLKRLRETAAEKRTMTDSIQDLEKKNATMEEKLKEMKSMTSTIKSVEAEREDIKSQMEKLRSEFVSPLVKLLDGRRNSS